MRFRSSHALLLSLVVTAGCAQSGSAPSSPSSTNGGSLAAGASTPASATVRFGNDTVGSPFPPPSGHDNSGHGRDNLIPRTAVIDQGGTVTFEMGGAVHQVGIYAPGTKPEQVSRAGAATIAGCPPVPYVTGAGDPNLVAIVGQPPCASGGGDWSVQYTFDTPGRYLVICTFIPHLDMAMYGWVEVRPRNKQS
jgi:plastocyanin